MNLYNVIKSRKTVREFLDQPVEDDKIKRILEAGVMAPTHDHLRNWEFVVITDKGLLLLHSYTNRQRATIYSKCNKAS